MNQSTLDEPQLDTATLEDELLKLAQSDPAEFYAFFRQVRDRHPEEATRACLRHLADHGADAIWQKAQFWIIGKSPYLSLLLDPDFLDDSKADQVGSILRSADHQFFLNFQAEIKKRSHSVRLPELERIVHVCQSLGISDILLSWLRTLTSHPDEYVRSRAAKALCILRPNLVAIERQLKSSDPRVRANAIEALWAIDHPDAARLFKSVLRDSSHRVVINALIGLYRMKTPGALNMLIECGNSTSVMMRRAAVWGMTKIADVECVPVLRKLAVDPMAEVSEKAIAALSALGHPFQLAESMPDTTFEAVEPPTVEVEQHDAKPVEEQPAPTAVEQPAAEAPAKPMAPPVEEKKRFGWKSQKSTILGI
jgi:hypothetical protein